VRAGWRVATGSQVRGAHVVGGMEVDAPVEHTPTENTHAQAKSEGSASANRSHGFDDSRPEEKIPLPSRELIQVQFPGTVESVDKGIAALGGSQALAAVLGTPGKMLQLRFRPEDNLSHPVFGDLKPCTSLLVKVKRSKRTPAAGEPPPEVKVEMVARVPAMYTFSGMADFQFIDLASAERRRKAERDRGKGEHTAEVDNFVIDMHHDVESILDDQAGEVMNLVPPIFSKIDTPQDYNFKQTPFYNHVEEQDEHGNTVVRHVPRVKKTVKSTVVVKWGDAVPSGPKKVDNEASAPYASDPVLPARAALPRTTRRRTAALTPGVWLLGHERGARKTAGCVCRAPALVDSRASLRRACPFPSRSSSAPGHGTPALRLAPRRYRRSRRPRPPLPGFLGRRGRGHRAPRGCGVVAGLQLCDRAVPRTLGALRLRPRT
jgi:hypothetical protein